MAVPDPRKLPPRLALAPGLTVLHTPGKVRLIGGEDLRYTLAAEGLGPWLAQWLRGLDGRQRLDEALAALPPEHRETALQFATRLYGERVLVEPGAAVTHEGQGGALRIDGDGALADLLRAQPQPESPPAASVLAQDRLDYSEALCFNRLCLSQGCRWFWATTGAASRAFVSACFLPDAGPCLECLVRHFLRLSPAPELYAELIDHAQQGLPIAATPFPQGGLEVVAGLLRWKSSLLAQSQPGAALYRLHVVETATLEVSAHRVYLDPECPACRGRR